MANILTYLNNILTAVYGKDVRQSIHDGLEAVNAEVVNTTDRQGDLEATFENLIINAGNSNAEVVAARYDNVNNKNHATVGERLDEVNSSLAESAKTALNKKGILYAGVIRNGGSGWSYIDDTVHNNINFTGISVTANNEIQVDFADSKLIGSMIVTPDETLASYGLTCGASVGDQNALIKCYAPFTGYIDGAGTIVGNAWFSGAYTVTALSDATGFTITYDGGGNSSEKVLANIVRDSSAPHNGLDIRCARGGVGQATLRAYHDLYGYVYYDGSAWQVATSCVANITMSFDSGTGVLTITHDSMNTASGYSEFQSVSVSPRKGATAGLVHPRINSVSQSQIKIEFYDSSGNLMTAPTTNMRVYMSRPGFRVPHTWNSGTKAFFDFGYSLVRPNKLISENGNLWLLGLHQAN